MKEGRRKEETSFLCPSLMWVWTNEDIWTRARRRLRMGRRGEEKE